MKKKLYEVRTDIYKKGGGIVTCQKFYFDATKAAEYAQKEKCEKEGKEETAIIKLLERTLDVPDDYKITTPERLAYDQRLTMREPEREE